LNRASPLFFEHEGGRAVGDGKWKLVSLSGDTWELYDLDKDPTEMRNLADSMLEKTRELTALWELWAKRCHVEK
jgi:arylsulfatase